MAQRFYLIDGYNLLHAAGFARVRYGPGDLHRARSRLLALLAEHLDDESRERIEIIFDAQDPPLDRSSEMRVHGMRVRYSVETGDADAFIEELILEHSAPRQLWVVSSDHRLIDAAKRRRARPLTSDVFLDKLLEGRLAARSPQPSAPKPDELPTETTDWLAFFGLDAAGTIVIETDQPNQTLPPIALPANEATPAPPSSTDKPHGCGSSDEPNPSSPAAEAAFWQRRIDELFEDLP